jgi:ribosomal protein L35AE/L33A
MVTVQIEHPIRDYASWRAAFDRDPAGREAAGVLRYRVSRPIDDPNYVLVDLDFAATDAAERFLVTMRSIWRQVQGTLIEGPRARIVECIEEHSY